ncbi:MAG: hypothetical protein QXQ92_05295 [Candidatus Nezhaarchaeales archaeon]
MVSYCLTLMLLDLNAVVECFTATTTSDRWPGRILSSSSSSF